MLIEFMEWLNKEIAELRDENQNRMYSAGKFSEAIRIRAQFLLMVQSLEFDKLSEELCSKYCKFPEAYASGREDDNERMIEERCNNCPLDRLAKLLGGE